MWWCVCMGEGEKVLRNGCSGMDRVSAYHY